MLEATPILRPGSLSERLPALRWQELGSFGGLKKPCLTSDLMDFLDSEQGFGVHNRRETVKEEVSAVREALEIDNDVESGANFEALKVIPSF